MSNNTLSQTNRAYRLIALDMDGTLLNSQKKVTAYTKAAIVRALGAGKHVVLSTGRCIPELREIFHEIPELRYAICVSGSMVYDIRAAKPIVNHTIRPELVNKVLDLVSDEDVMIHMLTDLSIVEEDKIERMERYGMGVYTPMYREVTSPVRDIRAFYREHPMPLNKLNLYHTDPDARLRTLQKLKALPLETAFAETTSLECSAMNVSKGTGLTALCEYLNIPIEETIAVGDADNDLAVLKTAGLSVAMGNANDRVKGICDAVVADCDHDGCAEAIEKYLMN